MHQPLLLVTAVCLLAAMPGCSNSAPRAAVSGMVTLDGKPLEAGDILFSPLESGPSAGVEIRQGRYELPREYGPGPSRYRVEINAWRETGKTVYDAERQAHDATLVSIIPVRYNRQSELEVNVEAGKRNTFDFELVSK